MCSLKAFMLKSLSPWKTSMLKPLHFYMMLTVFNYLMIFSALFEIHFFCEESDLGCLCMEEKNSVHIKNQY